MIHKAFRIQYGRMISDGSPYINEDVDFEFKSDGDEDDGRDVLTFEQAQQEVVQWIVGHTALDPSKRVLQRQWYGGNYPEIIIYSISIIHTDEDLGANLTSRALAIRDRQWAEAQACAASLAAEAAQAATENEEQEARRKYEELKARFG